MIKQTKFIWEKVEYDDQISIQMTISSQLNK